MAWIKAEQALRDHRKILCCADQLDIPQPYMLGLMINLWLWALDNAPTGSLVDITPRMLARAAQWDGDPNALVDALTAYKLLDVDSGDALSTHDWYQYAGRLIDQRKAKKERSARRRAAATAGQPPADRRLSGGRVDNSSPDYTTADYIPPIPPDSTVGRRDSQEVTTHGASHTGCQHPSGSDWASVFQPFPARQEQ